MIRLAVEGVGSFESLIKSNKLQTLVVIDKIRKTYTNEQFIAEIDTIQDLGQFLEIECSGPEGQPLEGVLDEIDSLMEGIPARPLAWGSFEMILRKEKFDLYRKGKYLLEEDIRSKVA